MSHADVAEVFYPIYKARSEAQDEQLAAATNAVLGLRTWLRSLDPTLPDIYDGNAWHPIEAQALRDHAE